MENFPLHDTVFQQSTSTGLNKIRHLKTRVLKNMGKVKMPRNFLSKSGV